MQMFSEIRSLIDRLENIANALSVIPTLTELDELVDSQVRTIISDELDVSDAVAEELQDRDIPDRDDISTMVEEQVSEIIGGWNSPVDDKVEEALRDARPDIEADTIEALGERLVSDEEFRRNFNGFLAGKTTDQVAEEVAS